MNLYKFIHNESAKNYITGITKENKIDIIEGKYNFGINDIIDNVVI